MANVGLLYVGAILFVNGLSFLGVVKGKGALPLNVLVGFLQVITPTYLIFTAQGDPQAIFDASGIYLFGFTYLYVAMNTIWGFDGTGLGWFSLFVAIAAIAYGLVSAIRGDYAFAVIWLLWAYLWWLFFRVLGREQPELTAYTGAVAVIQGWTTAAVPAFLLLLGRWPALPNPVTAIVIAVLTVGAMVIAKSKLTRPELVPRSH